MKQKLRKVFIGCAGTLVGLLVLPMSSPWFGELLKRVPFGWFRFLQRVLPRVTWNWSGIAMVALCSILIIAGTHWFCRWLYTQVRANARIQGPERWRWSWSAALF